MGQDHEDGAELLRLDGCKRLTAAVLAESINISNVRALSLSFCTGVTGTELIALAPSFKALEVLLQSPIHRAQAV